MMRRVLFAVCFLAPPAIVSCAHPQREVKLSVHAASPNKDQVTGFSTPADLRLGFLREQSSMAVYCAEPMPDVALGHETTASGSASGSLEQAASASAAASLAQENEELRKQLQEAVAAYEAETKRTYSGSRSMTTSNSLSSSGTLNLQAAYKLAVTVSELSGRSQQVLLAREFLYRLCEARANRFFVDDQVYVQLQNNALKLIESIASVQKPSELALRSEELKQINAYNESQTKFCALKDKACNDAAGADAAKKAACAQENTKCLAAIKPLSPGEVARPEKSSESGTGSGPARSDSALTDPVVKTPSGIK